MAIKSISDESFETDVIGSDVPVLVDFWAEWCGPCKIIGPALEEISDEMDGQIVVAKHNIDDFPEMPGKLGVRGIPTMILFKGGEAIATKVGAAPKSAIKAWIEQQI